MAEPLGGDCIDSGPETRAAMGGVTPCYLFRYQDITQKKTWMKLTEGDFNKCISKVFYSIPQ